MMNPSIRQNRCYRFTHTISRLPGKSVADGLRAAVQSDPDPALFMQEHQSYIGALEAAGVSTMVLPALETFPDSVFVEDPALCLGDTAVVLRPGAESRFGEAAAIEPELRKVFKKVVALPGDGYVDGGDILLTDTEAMIGLSDRTNLAGLEALKPVLADHGYTLRIVNTPPGVLHFKSDCSLLDSSTMFSTNVLARSRCFEDYNVIVAPEGEEAAANLIRVNDFIILRSGFEKTRKLLEDSGYQVMTTQADEAAKIDGGLSCMSLRFSLSD